MRKNFKNTRYALLLLMLLSLLIVACGDEDEDDSSDDGDNGGSTVELSQSATYNSASGVDITLSLPDGWVTEANADEDQLAFASNADTLAQTTSTELAETAEVEINGVGGIVTYFPADILTFIVPEGTDASAQAIYDALTSQPQEDVAYADASSFDVDGFANGVKASVTVGVNSGALYILYSDAGAVLFTVLSSEGTDTADAIARSTTVATAAEAPADGETTDETTTDPVATEAPAEGETTDPVATEAPAE